MEHEERQVYAKYGHMNKAEQARIHEKLSNDYRANEHRMSKQQKDNLYKEIFYLTKLIESR